MYSTQIWRDCLLPSTCQHLLSRLGMTLRVEVCTEIMMPYLAMFYSWASTSSNCSMCTLLQPSCTEVTIRVHCNVMLTGHYNWGYLLTNTNIVAHQFWDNRYAQGSPKHIQVPRNSQDHSLLAWNWWQHWGLCQKLLGQPQGQTVSIHQTVIPPQDLPESMTKDRYWLPWVGCKNWVLVPIVVNILSCSRSDHFKNPLWSHFRRNFNNEWHLSRVHYR